VMPCFMLIYQTIVLAEEDFLSRKFGDEFTDYRRRVNRWIPSLKGLSQTFSSMTFHWKRWLIKEYNTQFIWLCGITLILLFKFPQLTDYDVRQRNILLGIILAILLLFYLSIRYMKKSGRWRD